MNKQNISLEKFKALSDAVAKAGEENGIDAMELLTGLCQLIQSLMGRDKMTITFDKQRIEIK